MSNKDLRLLLIGTRSSPPTGQSVSFEMLLDYLDNMNLRYIVTDITPSSHSRRHDSTFEWHRVIDIVSTLPGYLFNLIRFRPTVYLLIGQSRVAFIRDCLFISLASLLRCRIIAHLKGGNYDSFYAEQPPWMQWLIKETLGNVDSLIILSRALTQCFHFIEDRKTKVHIVPNGLPMAIDNLQPVNLDNGKPINILYLSNLIESKGYWTLLETCRILKEQRIEFRCHFCGEFLASRDDTLFDSPAEARTVFLQKVEDWDLTSEVTWLGVVQGEAKKSNLEWAHVFVLPTRYINEGQPVSIIEALAFGKVIISTEYRAIPDMILHGQNGFLLQNESPDQIAAYIEYLQKNPGEIERMSQNSITLYQEKFTKKRHLSAILDILTDHG